MRRRLWTDESVKEVLAFLAVAHPRGGAGSCWSALPAGLLRAVAGWLLRPLCLGFDARVCHPCAFLAPTGRVLALPRRCGSVPVGPAGVAVCSPRMASGSGLFELEVAALELAAADRVCRVDVGVVANPRSQDRLGSGLRWLAADGDVYVAADLGGAPGRSGQPGWLHQAAPLCPQTDLTDAAHQTGVLLVC